MPKIIRSSPVHEIWVYHDCNPTVSQVIFTAEVKMHIENDNTVLHQPAISLAKMNQCQDYIQMEIKQEITYH